MVLVITFFMLALFSTFFYMIDMWYLALLPLAVFVFMLSHGIKNIFKWVRLEILREKWSLILIWFLTMVGLSWILFFIWIQEISVYLILLILNIFLWLWSHVFKYEDGKLIFEIWTRIINIIILWTALFSSGFFVFCEAFSLLTCLMLWVYAFLQYIIGLFYPTDEKRTYEIVILWLIAIWSAIIKYFYPAWWIISASLIILLLVYLWVYVVQHREMPSKEPKIISVRRILAGERIFKKINIPTRKISLYEWLDRAPVWFQRVLEFFNLWLLIFLLCFYFRGIFTKSQIWLDLWYRLWITFFLLNTFALKRIDYATNVSRFALALIVNFVLYSVLLISGSSVDTVLPFLILWGFACQIALFFVDRVNIKLFSNTDYRYWMVVTFIASLCNIILLCHSEWFENSRQFLISLVFIYVWIELMLLYYIVQFLRDREEALENAEEEEKKALQELANTDVDVESDF